MWSEETIEQNLKEGKLPCGRCHNWKLKKEFGKDSKTKKIFKVCKECNDSWKEKYSASKQKTKENIENKKEECLIM